MRPTNVRVNSLSPGAVETRRMLLRHGDMEAALAYNAPKTCLGRPDRQAGRDRQGRPLPCERSRGSSFTTGTDLLVDGGYTAM